MGGDVIANLSAIQESNAVQAIAAQVESKVDAKTRLNLLGVSKARVRLARAMNIAHMSFAKAVDVACEGTSTLDSELGKHARRQQQRWKASKPVHDADVQPGTSDVQPDTADV